MTKPPAPQAAQAGAQGETQPAAWAETALLLVDLQNDFLHPQGAYARGGVRSAAGTALIPRLVPLAERMRSLGGWVLSTHFTLVPGRAGEPFIAPHLRRMRPFLRRGDFAPASFGHALVEELQPADLAVEKVAYSAFYMTRLEWLLRQAGIRQLIVGGLVTNGGVASTVREAHVREFGLSVLSDGCAAFDAALHEASLRSLASIARLESCAAALARLEER